MKIKVRQLVWVDRLEGRWCKTLPRHYDVMKLKGEPEKWTAREESREIIGTFNDAIEAKAACQKYHEQFILSNIEEVQ